MPNFLCKACGVQHAESEAPPSRCIICEDARQFVPRAGQEWTTPAALAGGYFNAFRKVAPDLFGICTMPQFAIGQRAFLVMTPAGNVLWDCISLLDSATVDIVRALGGIKAVALSHPHFYSAMATWAHAFDCPVMVHEADRKWVVEPSPHIEFWSGETRSVLPGVTLHRLGGHFPGSAVLHWADRRTLLSVPLPPVEVERIGQRLAALDFDAIHSAFYGRGDIEKNAKAALARSVARHVRGPN